MNQSNNTEKDNQLSLKEGIKELNKLSPAAKNQLVLQKQKQVAAIFITLQRMGLAGGSVSYSGTLDGERFKISYEKLPSRNSSKKRAAFRIFIFLLLCAANIALSQFFFGFSSLVTIILAVMSLPITITIMPYDVVTVLSNGDKV